MQKYTNFQKQQFDELFGNKKKQSKIEKEFYEKTTEYLKFIKWIPGLRMIGIGNSVSMNSASKKSDIDLFIVTENNRLWFVRILVTFIFTILGVRKNDKYHAGRFCLSFFCEINGLDFSKIALKKDPYLYFWILYFKPILDYNNTYQLFLEKNKSWADFSEFINILDENKEFIKYKKKSPIIPFLKGDRDKKMSTEGFSTLNKNIQQYKVCCGKILDLLNNFFKKIFLPRTKKHYEKIKKPYGIIISGNMLKFHNNDIRKKIANKF